MKKSWILLNTEGGGGAPAPAATPAPSAPTPAAKPAVKPAAPAAAAPSTPAPAAKPAEPTSDDPFERPKSGSTPPKPAAPAAGDEDFEKLPPKDLRERVKQLNSESKAWKQKEQEFQAKIAAAEAKGKDTSVLTEQLDTLRKDHERVLGELRAIRQEASPEFKEKYDKPFNLAAERCKTQITELSVNNGDGTQRAAKWEDFAEIYSLPTGKAIDRAEELFGAKAAQFILGWREKLLDMDSQRKLALDEERAKYKQKQTEEEARAVTERESVNKTWAETNKRLSETTYAIDPTDKEALEARDHALKIFDAPVQHPDRQEFIKLKIAKDAHIRQKIGQLAVRTIQLEKANQKISELQATIDELRGSRPGNVQRSGGSPAPTENDDDWASDLKKTVTG
jgi:hypothetical protein